MIGGIKWIVRRHPDIAVVIAVVCWISAPFAADSGLRYWKLVINSKSVSVAAEVGVVVISLNNALRKIGDAIGPPWLAVAFALWFAAPVLVVEYRVLMARWPV